MVDYEKSAEEFYESKLRIDVKSIDIFLGKLQNISCMRKL